MPFAENNIPNTNANIQDKIKVFILNAGCGLVRVKLKCKYTCMPLKSNVKTLRNLNVVC